MHSLVGQLGGTSLLYFILRSEKRAKILDSLVRLTEEENERSVVREFRVRRILEARGPRKALESCSEYRRLNLGRIESCLELHRTGKRRED